MNILKTLGSSEAIQEYTDRPTVKVLIIHNDRILILNNGLLPGGGIDAGETHREAIDRELEEELGATVLKPSYIGTVFQYRSYLGKKYEVHGYTASLESIGGVTNPQDEGESQFKIRWMTVIDAITLVQQSLTSAREVAIQSDAEQGRLFNLSTTLAFLKQCTDK